MVCMRTLRLEKPSRQGKSLFFLPICDRTKGFLYTKRECGKRILFLHILILSIAFGNTIKNHQQGILYGGILKF